MDRAAYKSAAEKLSNRPAGKDHPDQKFKRGSKVHVCKEMPAEMRHFDSDFDAIVDHTYAQQFGGDDVNNYCLVMLDGVDPVNSLAWYKEDQLTLVSDDIKAGLEIIGQYRYRDGEEEDE